MRRFLQFLNAGPLTLPQIYRALVHTRAYYAQRRALCSRHALRPTRLPQLFWLQHRVDLSVRRSTALRQLQLFTFTTPRSLFVDQTEVRTSVPSRYEVVRGLHPTSLSSNRKSLREAWEKVYVREGRLDERVNGTVQNALAYLRSLQYVDMVSQWLVRNINLYHEALHQLIEGHREVTQDHNTKFEDGQTVREKLQAFEATLQEQGLKSKP